MSLSLILRPTVNRSVRHGIKHPSGPYDQIFICQTVAGLSMWRILSGERTGLSITIAADPRQRSHSRVRVPWNSLPYFTRTVSDSRLPFSSPPTTRRVTVEVFDPASTRVIAAGPCYIASARTAQKTPLPTGLLLLKHVAIARTAIRTPLPSYSIVCFTNLLWPFHSNGYCIAVYFAVVD
jgi:hypothetical protein